MEFPYTVLLHNVPTCLVPWNLIKMEETTTWDYQFGRYYNPLALHMPLVFRNMLGSSPCALHHCLGGNPISLLFKVKPPQLLPTLAFSQNP